MNKLKLLIGVLALAFLCSCNRTEKTEPKTVGIDYADACYWYAFGGTDKVADVFYVYPTVAVRTFAENDSSWFTDISFPEIREEAHENQRFNMMLYGDYNFFAPYYRQMIFDSYRQPDSVLNANVATAAQDVKAAFQYYMEHGNTGRPFFLMGHSQGSQMLIELLKDGMTDAQRHLMVAAYCIGYKVTAEDLAQYPERLCPAADSCEIGKIVLFNSAVIPEAGCRLFRDDVVGVNPLSWSNDTACVEACHHLGLARYNETRDSIVMFPAQTSTYLHGHLTVCPEIDTAMVYNKAFEDIFPLGNLHFADSWLFAGNVKANMACRLRHFLERKQGD